jgi:hypothetical protein
VQHFFALSTWTCRGSPRSDSTAGRSRSRCTCSCQGGRTA